MEQTKLKRWLNRYADAWENRDPEAAAALFTDHSEYHVTPFRSLTGRREIRKYWQEATADQREIDVSTEVIAVTDELGVGRFISERAESEKHTITDGICLVKLTDDKCSEFREWWHTSQDQ